MTFNNLYTIAIVCALPLEMAAVKAMMDHVDESPKLQDPNDKNNYTLGRIGPHSVVVACLPEGVYGITAATSLINWMLSSYRTLLFGVLVGIGGGVPSSGCDIRLGDVVVSKPRGTSPGIFHYDFGKAVNGAIIPNASPDKPPKVLLTAMASLSAEHIMTGNKISKHISDMLRRYPAMQERYAYPGADKDLLYEADYSHVANTSTCSRCDRKKLISRPDRSDKKPSIFYGTIGSGNLVIKDGLMRDQLANQHNLLCFEMEAAGLMDQLPCLVIRGISDYADAHKNKIWQEYAAATAAAYAKELLCAVPAHSLYDDQSGLALSYRSMSTFSTLNQTQYSPIEVETLKTPSFPSFIFMERFHLKENIFLGSIIPDRRYPHQDAFTPRIPLEEGIDFSVSVEQNFNEFASERSKSNTNFKKALSKLFLPPPFKGVEGDLQILSKESRVYTVLQPRILFKKLSSLSGFKDWLSAARTGKEPLYFIVGYRTVQDAQLIGKEIKPTQNRRFRAGVGQRTRYDTSGERIYAVCLRKIKLENSIERVGTLDPTNDWRPFYKTRGAGKEAEGFISADITNDYETGSSDFGLFPSQSGEELWTGT